MSLRVDLSESNMDLVMGLVRDLDCKPTDVINLLLNHINIIDARSIVYEEGSKVFKGSKENKEAGVQVQD